MYFIQKKRYICLKGNIEYLSMSILQILMDDISENSQTSHEHFFMKLMCQFPMAAVIVGLKNPYLFSYNSRSALKSRYRQGHAPWGESRGESPFLSSSTFQTCILCLSRLMALCSIFKASRQNLQISPCSIFTRLSSLQ